MSDEKVVETQTPEETQANNPSTEASEKNVPYDRFQEVVNSKNDMASQVGKLQAQIDKMNDTSKQRAEAKLVEDGKLKEALDIASKERDEYKKQSDSWLSYQTEKRESLMSKLTNDDDKSIADGLSDLNKLESYVNKVTNVNAPSTSSARATSGKAGEFGGYTSMEEWSMKDPEGCNKYLTENVAGYQWGKVK